MSQNVIQSSFAAGELAPSLFARTDLTKYHTGAAKMRNFFVDYRSGTSTRPGTKFVIQAFGSVVRLVRFQSSLLVPYIIEFGDQYCRFISNGAAVLEVGFAIDNTTNSNPATVTANGNTLNSGDWVFISGMGGSVQYNNRFYIVVSNIASVITLADVDGNPVDSTSYFPYTGGGGISRVYKIASPYAAADLELLKFSQLANVMYITHPSYPPYTLTLNTPTNWVFTQILFGTSILAPAGLAGSASTSGTANYAYVVTSVDASGQESLPTSPAAVANAVNIGTTAGTITLTWSAATNAVSYNVYKAELSIASAVPSGAAFGFIGSCTGVSFVDSNIVPDFTTTPPINFNPFPSVNNYPGANVFFQQRWYAGGTNNFPQTFYASQVGLYNNFNVSDPTLASDSITGTITSSQVNFIKSMLAMPGGLIIFTAQAPYQLSSGAGIASTSAVTPINATIAPQGYNGASDLPPIPINQDILYVQSKGSIVLDLVYNIYAAIYVPTDISVLSNHLFFNYTIKEWAWAQEPYKLLWAVRNDGILLSLTFVKEQEIYGWAHHDTFGLFQSVASVTEGQFDATYVAVQRFIGPNHPVIWIERFDNRVFTYGTEDAWCVDAGIMTTLPTPSASLFMSGSVGGATFSTDTPVFSVGAVGQVIRVDGGIATITSFVSSTEVIGNWTQLPTYIVPDDPNATPVEATPGNWSVTVPSTVFYGLDYLNGFTVSILADGRVQPPQVVAGGSIILENPATKVIVGLPFTAQLQTMPLDVNVQGGTIQGKRKKIAALGIRLANSLGLSAGRTFNTLVPLKENIFTPITLVSSYPLVTDYERVVMESLWDVPGQICIQQSNPLPATVLGVIPEIVIGDT